MCMVGGELTGYEAGMLERNEIASFLPFYTTNSNGRLMYWYDISGKRALRDYLIHRGITAENLCAVLSQLRAALNETGQYLIDEKHICIDPDTVFVEEKGSAIAIYLCYNAEGQSEERESNLLSFAEFLIQNVSHEDAEAEKLCYELYDMAASGRSGIDEMIEAAEAACEKQSDILGNSFGESDERTGNDYWDVATRNDSAPSAEADWQGRCVQIHAEEEEPPESLFTKLLREIRGLLPSFKSLERKKKELFPKDEPTDLIYEPKPIEYEPTVVIKEADRANAYGRLIYEGNGNESDFDIIKSEFRVGSANSNDAVIHSPTVSREHACITLRDGSYYLEDLNSTNGTYLNGELLAYRVPMPLKSSDRLRFADVPYRFTR